MREFKDSEQHIWEIKLTIGAATRVLRESDGKFNLFEPQENNLATTLLTNYPEFWEMLWLLIEPAAKLRNITADQFGELMSADCGVVARDRFFREWADFCRGLQREDQAQALETAIDMHAEALKKMGVQVREEMKTARPKLTEKIDKTLRTEFGNWQDSLASILAD